MTVRGILDCDNEPITVMDYARLKDNPLMDPDTIGLKGSPTNVFRSFSPPAKDAGQMLEGNSRDTIPALFQTLADKHII